MTAFWLILGFLAGLTVLWVFLIRRDVRAYVESQVKVLSEANRFHVDTPKLRFIFVFYGVVLVAIFGAYLLYFLLFL